MALALRDNAYHTYADYLAWPEDVRYELIDGMAYLMAPAPALDHQDIAGEIYFQLRRSLEGKSCRAFIAPVDGRYGESVMQELAGTTPVSVLPRVVIAWNALVSRLPKPDL